MEHFVSAIIPAAGSGKRMGSVVNKQYINLEGKPILAHTLSVFDKIDVIDEIIIVIGEGEEKIFKEKIEKVLKFKKPYKIVIGGKTRQESVYNGIKNIDPRCTVISVHDGARPLVLPRDIKRSIEVSKEYGGAVVGVPVKDTTKVIKEDGFVKETIKRDTLYSIQTPQTFLADVLIKANEYAIKNNIIATDDSSVVEAYGGKVKIVVGSYTNIKITTPQDLIYAQEFLSDM